MCALPGAAAAELRQALQLELGSLELHLSGIATRCSLPSLTLRIESPCPIGGSVTLVVRSDAGLRRRVIALEDIPEASRARARVIALAFAELIEFVTTPPAPTAQSGPSPSLEPTAASTAKQPAVPAPSTPPEAPRAAVSQSPARTRGSPTPAQHPARAAKPNDSEPNDTKPNDARRSESETNARAASTPSALGLGLGPEARWFFGGDALFGGRIAGNVSRLRAGASLLLADVSVDAGKLSTWALHALVGWQAAHVDLAARTSLAFVPRLGAGAIRVAGTPLDTANGSTALEPYFDGALSLELAQKLTRPLELTAGLEAGYARGLIALANQQRAAVYGGGFVGLMLGLQVAR